MHGRCETDVSAYGGKALTALHGGENVGLDFRFKSEMSLFRKVMARLDKSIAEAAAAAGAGAVSIPPYILFVLPHTKTNRGSRGNDAATRGQAAESNGAVPTPEGILSSILDVLRCGPGLIRAVVSAADAPILSAGPAWSGWAVARSDIATEPQALYCCSSTLHRITEYIRCLCF